MVSILGKCGDDTEHIWDIQKEVIQYLWCEPQTSLSLLECRFLHCWPAAPKHTNKQKHHHAVNSTSNFRNMWKCWLKLNHQRLKETIKISDLDMDKQYSYRVCPIPPVFFYPFLPTNVFSVWHCIRHKGQRISWCCLFTIVLMIYSSFRFFSFAEGSVV